MADQTKKSPKLIRVGVPKGSSILEDKAMAQMKKKGIVSAMARC